ncbi:MAG: hypothetical protein V4438_02785 [Patescibacteria group bacterium]
MFTIIILIVALISVLLVLVGFFDGSAEMWFFGFVVSIPVVIVWAIGAFLQHITGPIWWIWGEPMGWFQLPCVIYAGILILLSLAAMLWPMKEIDYGANYFW